MIDFVVALLALLTACLIMLPLFGAQKRSVIASEALIKQSVILKAMTDDDAEKSRIDFMIKVSRSWLLSFLLLFFAPLAAIREGLSLKRRNRKVSDGAANFSELFGKTLYFSNPVTMTVVIFLVVIGLLIGNLILFSLLTIWAFTANDGSKLTKAPSPRPAYMIGANINSVFNVYKQFKLGH